MNESEVKDFLLKNPWKKYKILVISEEKARSYRQVKYYFWVVVEILKDFHWYNEIEVNEILKAMFQKETFTDLSTKEFENIMSIIRQLWSEKYQVYIPKPNEPVYN